MQQECLDGLELQLALCCDLAKNKVGQHTGVAAARRCLVDVKGQSESTARLYDRQYAAIPLSRERLNRDHAKESILTDPNAIEFGTFSATGQSKHARDNGGVSLADRWKSLGDTFPVKRALERPHCCRPRVIRCKRIAADCVHLSPRYQHLQVHRLPPTGAD
jgi:hypothetical protein